MKEDEDDKYRGAKGYNFSQADNLPSGSVGLFKLGQHKLVVLQELLKSHFLNNVRQNCDMYPYTLRLLLVNAG